MKKIILMRVGVVGLGCFLGLPAVSGAQVPPPQAFSFSGIDAGGTQTDAYGLNAAGQVVGTVYSNYYCDDYGCYASSPHGFFWDSGTFTIIDGPGANETWPFGINGTGEIVGGFSDATGTHGFLKFGNTFTTIDVPGASFTFAVGINGIGQIVGTFGDAAGTHGFLKDGGTFTAFDVPGASASTSIQVSGINDAGQIVGSFAQGILPAHGFLKEGNTFTIIDVPGGYSTTVGGINDAGQIVGSFWDPATGYHGFLKDGDAFTTINVPGATHTSASGINDLDQIVGSVLFDSFPSLGGTGFLAVPAENTDAPPVASSTSACSDLTCNFDASSSSDPDGLIASFAWTFGDGTTGSGATISHTYAAAGTYTVTLTVTDNLGATSTQAQGVTVAPIVPPQMHVGDLDGGSTRQPNAWTALVMITVHNSSHAPLANAMVSGSWSTGGTGSCMTDGSGQCAISKSMIPKKTGSAVFTILEVTSPTFLYNSNDNHDPDGDSNGTTVSITRP